MEPQILDVVPAKPKKVEDRYLFWIEPPPKLSDRCVYWLVRINNGWQPNRRIRIMGYDECSEWFGVYIWEYINVLSPAMRTGHA